MNDFSLRVSKNIYIKAISHISNQKPLSEEWFEEPIFYSQKYVRSIEPDYKEYFSLLESRRMGLILKRALVTAINVTRKSKIMNPDAIITGTGLGCIENTEKFLTALIKNDEEMLTPTHFMQSTHNTISSNIAINFKCHGYNSTYSHCGTSFDSALYDAFIQFQLGEIHSALVSGQDELTPDYFKLLKKIPYLKNVKVCGSEASVSFMLSDEENGENIAKISDVILLNKPEIKKMLGNLKCNLSEIDAIVVGNNGDVENDEIYNNFINIFDVHIPVIQYKQIFGESYSISGLGLYTAAEIIKKQKLPVINNYGGKINKVLKKVLFYNHYQNKNHCLILLEML
ncbi:MAG: beta-ketoacyl synthase chain length factor [Bacteroidales bacterium]|jgi:hypothetical protein|nr:beta-ketoacyl synthase chain length factor [Bacteroidales bacterium]